MTISIDTSKCIGCGTCAALKPDFFEVTNEGKARAKVSEIPDASVVKEAVESCPVQAISVQ